MRPPGPEPGTNCNSMPRSQARRLTAGEASGFGPKRRAGSTSPTTGDSEGPTPEAWAGEGDDFRALAIRFRRLALWRGVRDRTIVLRRIPHPGDIEHDKLGPDRALFARLAIDRDDGAAHWCRQFDRCLVGHDVDERILL